MKIVVGSTSPQKKNAVQQALLHLSAESSPLELICCSVDSGVSVQPVGIDETARGARNRAVAAQHLYPDAVCIGIESGIIRGYDSAEAFSLDVAVIAVFAPNGKSARTTSLGIQLPEALVVECEQRGFANATVGDVIAEQCGGQSSDPHAALTQGKVMRSDTLVQAVYAALIQVLA